MAQLINLRASIDQRRISRILTNLRESASPALFKDLDFTLEADRLERYLKQRFPKSRAGTRTKGSKAETTELGVNRHLAEGWKASVESSISGSISVSLQHLLSGEERIRTILSSLDSGSRAYQWVVRAKKISFKDLRVGAGKKDYVHLPVGTVVDQPAREGFHYTDATMRYVVNTLIPRLRARIQNAVKTRLERD